MTRTEMQACIDECIRCMQACNACYEACLKEDGLEMMRTCIRLDRECADICGFAAQAMAQGSTYYGELCLICAEACESCGAECAKHETEHCRRCAEACYACAGACIALVDASVEAHGSPTA
ncbi:four-helix bundle copper-binding protein [Cohnella nanjingensis]|uniref:Four-helix bundle copper-binding protein n=1 Tax=Cohnella nanjingensis TaxID=1387779 RepID=A0A7X0RTQ8_9BACL|nr:four-helix bundle copper-binding protein [Cohnella nanjingensis]MBB6672301.1 four-helix bundle copper-binding protein [Cohnella nanjingensis]